MTEQAQMTEEEAVKMIVSDMTARLNMLENCDPEKDWRDGRMWIYLALQQPTIDWGPDTKEQRMIDQFGLPWINARWRKERDQAIATLLGGSTVDGLGTLPEEAVGRHV